MMADIRATILSATSDPNIAFLFLVFGLLGLYFEFSSPGAFLPGVIGGVLLLLGVSSFSSSPANETGPALLLIALACFVLEVKFSTHGLLGIAGLAFMILGALLMHVSLLTALLVSIPFGLITTFLVALAVGARRNKAVTGIATMIDELGVAATEIQPEGQILVRGEYWTAACRTPVQAGEKIRVTAVHGLRLEVEPWV